MGYLMDTNVIIEYIADTLPSSGTTFIDNLPPIISVITRIELLGWKGATAIQLAPFQNFINFATILPLDEAVIQQTILIRQTKKIKTPDAVIAATALVHGYQLITHNTTDFNSITELTVIDSHTL